MSLDNHTLSSHPWGRISGIGTPWHGLVKNDLLPLSNGYDLTYPQPDAGFEDQAGDTHLVQVPGMPEVERTASQAARDVETGAQWRNKAMLSGSRQQICGQDLNGWIYIDDNKDRWWVQCGDAFGPEISLSSPLTLTLTLRRFGVFSPTPDTTVHSHVVTLTDLQQSGTLTIDGSTNITSASMSIHAIQPQGQAAAIMLAKIPNVTPPRIDPMGRYPVGFLQVAISGPGDSASVSLTVLRSRAQVFSAIGATIPSTPTATHTAGDITWGYPGDPGYPYQMSFLQESSAAWPPPGVTSPFSAQVFSVTAFSYTAGGSWRYIIGIFASDSGWLEVAHELEWSHDQSASDPIKVGDLPCSVSVTHTMAATAALRLKVGVGTVWETTATSNVSSTTTGTITETPSMILVESASEWTVTLDGNLRIGSDSGSAMVADANIGGGTAALIGTTPRAVSGFSGIGGVQSATIDAVDSAGDSEFHEYVLMRYSNTAIGMCDLSEIAGVTSKTYLSPITPSGITGSAVTASADPYYTQYYGSWCPHTHAVSWRQTQPVCWV